LRFEASGLPPLKEMPMKNTLEKKLDLNYVLNKDRVQNNGKGKKAFKVI
jgi:hypothetical protein